MSTLINSKCMLDTHLNEVVDIRHIIRQITFDRLNQMSIVRDVTVINFFSLKVSKLQVQLHYFEV